MLFKALAVFASRDINLIKVIVLVKIILSQAVSNNQLFSLFYNFQIESRPQRKRPLRVVDDSNKGSAK